MDTVQKVFDKMCRTCMDEVLETSGKQLQCIFDKVIECEELSIAELLSITIPRIKVQQTDELPKTMCSRCLHQLKNAYNFQKMCLQADQHIRQLIANTISKAGQRIMGFKYMNSSPEELQPTSADPSESFNNANDNKNIQIIFSEHVKTKPCDNAVEKLIPTASTVYDLSTKDLLMSKDEGSNIEHNTTIPEKTSSSAASLQSNNEPIEHCEDLQIVVKNEPCEDDEYIPEDNNGKTSPSMTIAIDPKSTSLSLSTHDCPLCNKSFIQSRLLKRHLERHKKWDEKKERRIDQYRYRCDICNRPFYILESLEKHRLTHEEIAISSYSCEHCKGTFSSPPSLRQHKSLYCEKNTQKISKEYSCKSCKKTFENNAELKAHRRIHVDEQHVCPECSKSFISEKYLRQHLMRHSEVKPFECPHCPLKFHCAGDVTQHKLVHEGIKPYVCDVCDKRFSQRGSLKTHKMYHTGERPYKCDFCDMGFVIMEAQRRHMRTHTGEKPYKCKYCERAFSQSGDHIKHLRIHLGENVYRCELCPSAFRLSTELRTHYATHEKDNTETHERNLLALKEEETKLELQLAAKKNLEKIIAKERNT